MRGDSAQTLLKLASIYSFNRFLKKKEAKSLIQRSSYLTALVSKVYQNGFDQRQNQSLHIFLS
ncbi:hypothetical protein BpHYR1_048581 [Brachionus plicatilis]|uniref:Uncharacterized protein n=1 Tax=Brachionus plicatilis TaxID=10195 RepID=A0A3M7S392_BRAPC|nr:hypothetical protein BpHYR1_048581 [Brachionus plicatilis]